MKRFEFLLAIIFLVGGCIPVYIGAGIVTGFVLSNDSAAGNVKAEYRQLWDLCLNTLENMEAQILSTNESRGVIKALVSENDLTIRVTSINPTTQHLKVCARRYLFPKSRFAQKVFFEIIEDLEEIE